MIEIPLTQGFIAIIDDEDAHLAGFKWCVSRRKHTNYARRRDGDKTVYLHKAVAGESYIVDHIDGNGLNCTRANLRMATPSQNNFNAERHSHNRSGYKGVRWSNRTKDPKDRPWRAEIRANGKYRFLGQFSSPEEAALAYNEAAHKLHGEYARLNIVP